MELLASKAYLSAITYAFGTGFALSGLPARFLDPIQKGYNLFSLVYSFAGSTKKLTESMAAFNAKSTLARVAPRLSSYHSLQ
jgi:hypothetical protein